MFDEVEKYLKNYGLNCFMFVENNKPIGQSSSINFKHNKYEENYTND